MRRAAVPKFPNSVQLFKFCQKILTENKGAKVHDQEVGSILSFNPSDCSHWKRGEKNVKSVFSLSKIATALRVDPTLIHDIASGLSSLDEAYYEYREAANHTRILQGELQRSDSENEKVRKSVLEFVQGLHEQSDYSTAPLYLPEVLRYFSFISSQPVEMMDRLSRILRVKAGKYVMQYKKGELKPQTRMSMAQDLGKIIFEAERNLFPELGAINPLLLEYEQMLFVTNLLMPKKMVLEEMTKLDSRKNMIAELATIFWTPKSLVSLQLQNLIQRSETETKTKTATHTNKEIRLSASTFQVALDNSL